MKHFSHFVKSKANKLKIVGNRNSELAFKNTNGEIVLVAHNKNQEKEKLAVKIGERLITLEIPNNSINTFTLSGS